MTFYKDKDVKLDTVPKSVLAGLGIVFGIVAVFAGLGRAVTAAAGRDSQRIIQWGHWHRYAPYRSTVRAPFL